MGTQFRKLFGAHFKSTFREKQVWFWSVFYPVLLLVVFLTIFGGSGDDKAFSAKVAVAGDASRPGAEQMVEALEHISALEWKSTAPVTKEQAEEWVKNKDIDAAIVLPEEGKTFGLILNREKEQSTTAQAMAGLLNEFVHQANDQAAQVQPTYTMHVDYVTSGSTKLKYSDFLLTGLIALSIAQAGLFGMVGMVEMRRNGLLKRLKLTPVNMKLFGLSNMMVRFILSAIQVVLLTIIGILFYHARLDVDVPGFLLIFLTGTLSFAALGFMIASLSKSMDSYFGIANLVSFLMMFLSGIFFDTATLPDFLKPVAQALPLTYFANGVRDGMVYGLNMLHPAFWINLAVLAGWGILALLVGSRFYKWKAEPR